MATNLGPLLLQAGIVDEKQLEETIEQAKRRNLPLWEIILEERQVSEDSLADAFANWLKIPRVRIASANVDPEALRLITEDLARKHMCLPLHMERNSLVVAMGNPADYAAIQDLQFAAGRGIRAVVATRSEILDAIETRYSPEEKADDFLANVSDDTDLRIFTQEKEEVDLDNRQAAELPPVVKMCNLVIRDAIKSGASDIHIEPTLNAVQVRLRIDGVLRDYMQVPKWLHGAVASRLKILAKLDIAERRLPQDGRIKVQIQGKPVDIRVSTLPTHFGEKVVMRLLGSSEIPTMAQLGLTDGQIALLEQALFQPQGLILVTGPTGSGKSTSLYSMLSRRRSPEVNIITVEDPIEYQLAGVNQVQVNAKAGLTFAGCLRSILRQDPDVILVGEIRDLETAEIAFQASMTGHMVLSTLHTNSTLATIARLIDLGVDPPLITSSINLIIAQRLARRVCVRCREEYEPSSALLEKLRMDRPDITFYRGRGCPSCGHSGFSGRVGIYEILRLTPSLKELILRKAGEGEMRKAAGLAGTRFLLEEAMDKVRQGITTLEEVLRVVQLQEEDVVRCPRCSSFINLDFSTCPYCLFSLKHLCEFCGQELKLEWRTCPYCNSRAQRWSKGLTTGVAPQPPGPPLTGMHPHLGAAAPGPPAAAPALVTGDPHAANGDSHLGPAANPAQPAAPEPGERSAESKIPRILVVDDDDSIKVVIKKALQQLPIPIEVETASDGVDALEAVEKNLPDLVILDVMMPRMDGFGVCQKLREQVRTAFVPVMMLTANADESARIKGYLVGTDDYVNKPFSVPDLNARVTRLLRRTYGL